MAKKNNIDEGKFLKEINLCARERDRIENKYRNLILFIIPIYLLILCGLVAIVDLYNSEKDSAILDQLRPKNAVLYSQSYYENSTTWKVCYWIGEKEDVPHPDEE